MGLTNAQMVAAIAAGGSVLYRGTHITNASACPSDNTIAADDAADLVTNAQMDVGGSTAFTRTSAGVTTLVAGADLDRAVIIHLEVITTFAAGDGAAPVLKIGETGTDTKFLTTKNTGTAGDKLTYAGILSSGKALIVTSTAATGTTSTGAYTVTALTLPTL